MQVSTVSFTSLPEGVVHLKEVDGGQTIKFVNSNNGCLILFVSVWLSLWSASCVALTLLYMDGWEMENGISISVFMLYGFYVGWCFGFLIFLRTVLLKKTFLIRGNLLRINSEILSMRWSSTICRESVKTITVVKDGGEGDDSFHTWGVKVEFWPTKNSLSCMFRRLAGVLCGFNGLILSRADYDQSEWLRLILLEWLTTSTE